MDGRNVPPILTHESLPIIFSVLAIFPILIVAVVVLLVYKNYSREYVVT
jgi:hypothetical protein